MSTEPIRRELLAYLNEQRETSLLPEAYRSAMAPVRQEGYTMPPELLAGMLATQQMQQQQMLALASRNAELQLAAAVNTRVSGRAKDIAVVSLAGGFGVGGAATGIGFAVGMIAANAAGLMTAGVAVLLAGGGIALLKLVFAGGAFKSGGGNTYVTYNNTVARGVWAKSIGGPTSNG